MRRLMMLLALAGCGADRAAFTAPDATADAADPITDDAGDDGDPLDASDPPDTSTCTPLDPAAACSWALNAPSIDGGLVYQCGTIPDGCGGSFPCKVTTEAGVVTDGGGCAWYQRCGVQPYGQPSWGPNSCGGCKLLPPGGGTDPSNCYAIPGGCQQHGAELACSTLADGGIFWPLTGYDAGCCSSGEGCWQGGVGNSGVCCAPPGWCH